MRAKIVACYFQSLEILHEKLALSSLRRLTSSCDSDMYSLVPVNWSNSGLQLFMSARLDGLDHFNDFQSNISRDYYMYFINNNHAF